MDRNVNEVHEAIRRRQREASKGRREQDQANGEQARRIREVVREAAKKLKGDVPEGTWDRPGGSWA